MVNYRNYYYKYKALKYYLKNNSIEKQKQIKGGSTEEEERKGTGQKIIELFNEIINIYDNYGEEALKSYLNTNNLILHGDNTNNYSLEENINNIRYFTDQFYKKYNDSKGNLKHGYEDFNSHAIGSYVCIDAKIEVLASFLSNENPFLLERPKDQILGTFLNQTITYYCNKKKVDNDNLKDYKLRNNKVWVIGYFTGILQQYIPKYVTQDEINKFLDTYLEYYLHEEYKDFLDCDGNLSTLLLKENEKENEKEYRKKKLNEVNLDELKEGDILHSIWGKDVPIRIVNQYNINNTLQKINLKNEFTHVSILQKN